MQAGLAEAIVQLGTQATGSIADAGRTTLLNDLKSIAAAELDDPHLTPATVAARAGVSVRTLHRTFQASGETFWNWIRDRRLDRCYAELTTPIQYKRPITEVAFRWGFNELSTFDRAGDSFGKGLDRHEIAATWNHPERLAVHLAEQVTDRPFQ